MVLGHRNKSLSEKTFILFNTAFLLFIVFLMLFPFLNIVAISFSSPIAVLQRKVSLIPVDFSLKAYEKVFNNEWIWISYKNTLIYTTVGVLINLIAVTCAAYPLSRKSLRWRKWIILYFTFTMLFDGGLIPSYLVVSGLGLRNTLWALVLPKAVSIYYMFILRTFFESIPEELYEAARIDGMGYIGILLKIYIPLSIPIYAALVLFFAVMHWNSWFDALIFLVDKHKFPLQMILRDIVLAGNMQDMEKVYTHVEVDNMVISENLKTATIIVSTAPILTLYPFVQKYFVKGMMLGAVKG